MVALGKELDLRRQVLFRRAGRCNLLVKTVVLRRDLPLQVAFRRLKDRHLPAEGRKLGLDPSQILHKTMSRAEAILCRIGGPILHKSTSNWTSTQNALAYTFRFANNVEHMF